jgi:hypothetical protein
MKRLFWLAILASVVLITSCSKDSDDAPAVTSFITFNLDGVPVACNSAMSVSFPQGEDLTVSGAWAGGNIKLEIFEDAALVEGVYLFAANQHRRALLTVGSTLYTAGTAGGTTVAGFGSIEIVDIDPTYISGKFNFETAVVGGSGKLVMDGNFKVAR